MSKPFAHKVVSRKRDAPPKMLKGEKNAPNFACDCENVQEVFSPCLAKERGLGEPNPPGKLALKLGLKSGEREKRENKGFNWGPFEKPISFDEPHSGQ